MREAAALRDDGERIRLTHSTSPTMAHPSALAFSARYSTLVYSAATLATSFSPPSTEVERAPNEEAAGLVEDELEVDGLEEEAGGMSSRVSVRVRESVKLRRSWRRV